jgi:hypothetical protein
MGSRGAYGPLLPKSHAKTFLTIESQSRELRMGRGQEVSGIGTRKMVDWGWEIMG